MHASLSLPLEGPRRCIGYAKHLSRRNDVLRVGGTLSEREDCADKLEPRSDHGAAEIKKLQARMNETGFRALVRDPPHGICEQIPVAVGAKQ